MEKTGLVLEGGGLRGIYTAGVLDVFMDKGLSFDGLIGVSAGAIHGCSFMSNQRGRSIRYYKNYCTDPRFMSWKSWLTTGNVVGVDFCYHELPDVLDPFDHETFYKNQTEYYVTCSNLDSGEAEYIPLTDMKQEIDYLRASASLPFFSHIVRIGNKKYLDGGCCDSVPLKAFFNMGFKRNVVVLTQPKGYRKEKGNALAIRLFYGRYPKYAKALMNRHLKYNETMDYIDDLEEKGEIFVIRPKKPLNIGRLETDPIKVEQVYNFGFKDGTERADKAIEWLKG